MLAGGLVAVGLGLLILAYIFSRAVVAWGIFGAFLVVAFLLLVSAWLYDRRQAKLGD